MKNGNITISLWINLYIKLKLKYFANMEQYVKVVKERNLCYNE